jgi:hypothetical protein
MIAAACILATIALVIVASVWVGSSPPMVPAAWWATPFIEPNVPR